MQTSFLYIRDSVHVGLDQDMSNKGRSKDKFWDYVLPAADGKVSCRYCEDVLSPDIASVKEHLSNWGDIIDCGKVPPDVRKAAEEALGGPKKSVKRDRTVSGSVTSITTVEAIGGGKKGVKLMPSSSHVSKRCKGSSASLASASTTSRPHASKELCISNNLSMEAVHKEMLRFFLLNNIPFGVAQTTSFKCLVNKLATHGPGYELPSCQNLNALVPEVKTKVEGHSTNVQKSWDETGCTLVFIFKKDGSGRKWLHICAHARKGLVFVDQMDITFKSEKQVKEFICSVIERIGRHHVVQFITNAEKFKSSFEGELASKFPHVYWTSCAARHIHSLLKDIYEQVEWVKKVMDDASQIAIGIHQHNDILLLMKGRANWKELKQPCRNIVASMFSTLKSIFDVEHELQLLVASSKWRGISNEMANKITNIIQDREFWSRAKDLLKGLCPIVRVLELVESDGLTFGYLYQAMDMASTEIEQLYANNEEKYKGIFDLFRDYYFKKIIHPVHVVAAFLNPGYTFMMDEQKMSSALDKVVASDDWNAFNSEISDYRRLKQEFFSANLLKSNSWSWWNSHKGYWPVLSKYVMRILAQPSSSSSCERLNWSNFEPTQLQKSNCPDFADVKMELMMMEKSNLMTKNANEPINFGQLSELSDYTDFVVDDPSHIWEEVLYYSLEYSLEYLSSIYRE